MLRGVMGAAAMAATRSITFMLHHKNTRRKLIIHTQEEPLRAVGGLFLPPPISISNIRSHPPSSHQHLRLVCRNHCPEALCSKSNKTPDESAKNSQCQKFLLCCGISRKGYVLPGIVESHNNIRERDCQSFVHMVSISGVEAAQDQ